MDKHFTEAELVSFLDYAANKGLLNRNTAQGRRVATLKVLQALDDHEKTDLRTIDREATFSRFVNRFGKEFNPASLQVYRSRFNSALSDFLRYQEDPTSFKPSPATRQARTPTEKSPPSKSAAKRTTNTSQAAPPAVSPPRNVPESFVFPVPLRAGLTVEIHNLPIDLTPDEAARISAVVNALAVKVQTSAKASA